MANEADRDLEGFFPDVETAQTRQDIQVGTAIAFFILAAANIVHGALIHEDVVETSYGLVDEADPEDLPPEPEIEPESRILTPDWGVSWEIRF
jgi:hypothetical protein